MEDQNKTDLPNSMINVTYTHICISIGDLENAAEEYLKLSQMQKSQKMTMFYMGKREMCLKLIWQFNSLKSYSQAKSGII